ncbi:HNH endonuclease signature motif containing protein [Pseudactinotalea sp. Z1732]|uniref:HNH endonuclease signature motif containing protein n=1 Tax=Micrococcales TaxID=85006 RepID=UPI003C7DAF42
MAGVQVIPFSPEQLVARIAFYGGVCWICREVPYEELDHVKPVKAGGPHMLANLRPACRSCNASKNASWPFVAPGPS